MKTEELQGDPSNLCAFCGSIGRMTKEHVWPQWLRSQGPAHQLWSPRFQGQRAPLDGTYATNNDQGVVEHVSQPGPAASTFLATVTTKVCGPCNRQWNERLEKPVQQLLGPVFAGGTTALTTVDQRLLAAWAIKCFVAYARGTKDPRVDPFPASERRRQAKPAADPHDRWDLWIGWSPGADAAHMSLAVREIALSHRDDDLTYPPPYNTAVCWLAANGVILFGLWRPDTFPRDVAGLLIPPELQGGLTRLWPTDVPEPRWPTRQLPSDVWDQLRQHTSSVLDVIGLPEQGLTATQRQTVMQAFLDGGSPQDLRRSHARAGQ